MHPLADTLTTPAFLGKLWKMVNDPLTDHLICWSPAGNSFLIQNQAQFMYELLPLYYKHNNMSSFVRQLNMYGFHKLSSVDNGTLDADRDEIQFSHPFFIKNQPQLLHNIKRKATPSKAIAESLPKHDELSKILTDVKQLRGRQASVDNQLMAMKQENALLWREVAILRQKHLKQQKIVNKLIQFLVTLVQPSRMTVGGLKRGYQLMLNESPNKKKKMNDDKSDNIDGPTIHELDNELDLTPDLYDQDQLTEEGQEDEEDNDLVCIQVNSPITPKSTETDNTTSPIAAELLVKEIDDMEKPEFISIGASTPADNGMMTSATLLNPQGEANLNDVSDKVFLNPSTQDTLLSNLINGTNYARSITETHQKGVDEQTQTSVVEPGPAEGVTSGSRELIRSGSDYGLDLNNHVENTQIELDQFKDLLNSYNTYVDANELLGELTKIPRNYNNSYLLNENSPPPLAKPVAQEVAQTVKDAADPLVGGGGELTLYTNGLDFDELFDESLDEGLTPVEQKPIISSTLSTPQAIRDAPVFPSIQNEN